MKPIFFQLGALEIHSYGTMIALGVLAALFLMLKNARRDGFPDANVVYDSVFVVLLTGFLGARLYYIIENFQWYRHDPLKILAIWEGGLIFYGGTIGSLIGLALFAKNKNIKYLNLVDFLIPYEALVHAFGRMGCFLNGCCNGIQCDLPWAVRFPGMTYSVHPVQLYEMVFNLFLFLFLLYFYRRRKQVGSTTAFYLVTYGMGRFMIEFLRPAMSSWLMFSWNQWVSLGMIIFGITMHQISFKNYKKDNR